MVETKAKKIFEEKMRKEFEIINECRNESTKFSKLIFSCIALTLIGLFVFLAFR